MKKIYALLIAVLVLCSACQRSQFATTTRICKKGKVSYTKNYYHESRKLFKGISHRNGIKSVEIPSAVDPDSKLTVTPETIGITSGTETQPENLIASATMGPAFTAVKEKNDQGFAGHRFSDKGSLRPDTVVPDNQKHPESKEVVSSDDRKVEKLGLAGFILSIPGLVPIICLPLAILGLIFGIISLRRIKRNPALYKGKGFAIAGIILGVLGILGILLFIG
jgi:hypothetical protein